MLDKAQKDRIQLRLDAMKSIASKRYDRYLKLDSDYGDHKATYYEGYLDAVKDVDRFFTEEGWQFFEEDEDDK